MEQTQPLKKRIVEIASTEVEQKEMQRTSRIRQYGQYVPVAQVRAQPVLPPIQPQILRQKQTQKQPQKQAQSQTQMKAPMQPPMQYPMNPPMQPPMKPKREPQAQPQPHLQSKTQAQLQRQPQDQPQRQSKTESKPSPQPQAQTPQLALPQSIPQAQPQSQLHPIAQPSLQLQAQLQKHLKTQMESIGSVIEVPSREEQQHNNNGIKIIEHIYREPPMMLNAWTQTSSDDLIQAAQLMGELKTAVLIARIETLQESLRESYDYINANLNVVITPAANKDKLEQPAANVEEAVTVEESVNVEAAASVEPIEEVIEEVEPLPITAFKNDVQTYRILSQGNEYNSDDNIEIEVSLEASEVNNENNPPSPAKVYKIRKTPNREAPPKMEKTEGPQIPCGPKRSLEGENCIAIGPNQTKVPEGEFKKISWGSASIATRKLLTLIFDRETLATHSMTGKASPAFKDLDKPVKGRLDPVAVQDIIHVVSQKCGVSAKEVRSAITTKCADENKMLKLKQMKRLSGETKRPILGELRPRNSGQIRKSNAF